MSMWSLEWQEVVDNVRQEEYMKNLLWVDDFPDVQNGGPAVAGGKGRSLPCLRRVWNRLSRLPALHTLDRIRNLIVLQLNVASRV